MRKSERIDPVVPLLACPFDKGPAMVMLEIWGPVEGRHQGEIGLVHIHIHCHECGARGPWKDGYALDDEDVKAIALQASKAWNKVHRAADQVKGDT